ncbi:MAG: hypothetical protein E2O96_07310 [Acidobacteria bacterium]|nr:MAG: hypothetical protein E2O96_07310 [Acidobacteriota bacterium]
MTRQKVHRWLRRYAACESGLGAADDRLSLGAGGCGFGSVEVVDLPVLVRHRVIGLSCGLTVGSHSSRREVGDSLLGGLNVAADVQSAENIYESSLRVAFRCIFTLHSVFTIWALTAHGRDIAMA